MGIGFGDGDEGTKEETDPAGADDGAEPQSISVRPFARVPFNPASRSAADSQIYAPSHPETTQSSSRPNERVTSGAMSRPTFESASRSYSLHESTSHLIVDIPFSRQTGRDVQKAPLAQGHTQHRSAVIA